MQRFREDLTKTQVDVGHRFNQTELRVAECSAKCEMAQGNKSHQINAGMNEVSSHLESRLHDIQGAILNDADNIIKVCRACVYKP